MILAGCSFFFQTWASSGRKALGLFAINVPSLRLCDLSKTTTRGVARDFQDADLRERDILALKS
jgi:hypothetical protein